MASTIKVDNVQNTPGTNVINKCGTAITIGASGDTVSLASGASQSGFKSIDFCTTAKTTGFTAVAGKGYFVNTCGGAVTVTLPASPNAGDQVEVVDLKGTFNCNAVTLGRNSKKMKGTCEDLMLKGERQVTRIIYTGACQGWVAELGINATDPALKRNAYTVQYLVVAGGGGGGVRIGGGGGAGGYRTICSKTFEVVPGTTYPVTVGGAGSGGCRGGPTGPYVIATSGTNSVFSTITSAGGGHGATFDSTISNSAAADGGSGGGGSGYAQPNSNAGTGNEPEVSPSQGNDGGKGRPHPDLGTGNSAGGGGGAGTGGTPGNAPPEVSGPGGNGSSSTITGTAVTRAGGGGGGGASTAGTGGPGGGGNGKVFPGAATAGCANTGGGGGGNDGPGTGGNGGSGIVVIRRLTADSTSTSGTVTTSGCDTIHTFTGTGTFVA